jgi:hypothetical protein
MYPTGCLFACRISKQRVFAQQFGLHAGIHHLKHVFQQAADTCGMHSS